MTEPMYLALLLTAAVGLTFYAFIVPRTESYFAIQGIGENENKSRWLRVLGVASSEILATLPAGIADKVKDKPTSDVELLFQQSGNPWNLRSQEFFMVKIITGIIGFIGGLGFGWVVANFTPIALPLIAWAALWAFFGFRYPNMIYSSAAKDRDIDFKRQLPDALDLMIISLSSGSTFPTALRDALPNMEPSVLKDEFTVVSQQLDSGKTLHDSLSEFIKRAPSESVTAFVRAVQEATALNVPVVEVLQSRAEASRQEYFSLLQQKIASLETRMMAIITPTLIPALMITATAPALSSVIEMMGS